MKLKQGLGPEGLLARQTEPRGGKHFSPVLSELLISKFSLHRYLRIRLWALTGNLGPSPWKTVSGEVELYAQDLRELAAAELEVS